MNKKMLEQKVTTNMKAICTSLSLERNHNKVNLEVGKTPKAMWSCGIKLVISIKS